MKQIKFNSSSHQRFERGVPVKGLQNCGRVVIIEENINGCRGYDLTKGDGYIVSIKNLDANHPVWGDNYQMSPKPMRLINMSDDRVELRGYEVLVQTPFGWMNVDQSDYGITLFQKNNEIVKCRLDMFDRDTYIEYYK